MSAQSTFETKRGEDLELSGVPDISGVTDYSGWSAAAQVRDVGGGLVDAFDITFVTVPTPMLTLFAPAARTAKWPLGTLRTDVRFVSPAGRVIQSPTGAFTCVERITGAL